MFCPYCGGNGEYLGADDGGGDYGDSVCDMYRCGTCDTEFEGNCVEFDGEDYEEEDGPDFEV